MSSNFEINKDAIWKKAEQAARTQKREITCPGCGTKIMATIGINVCPHCKKTIKFDLTIHK